MLIEATKLFDQRTRVQQVAGLKERTRPDDSLAARQSMEEMDLGRIRLGPALHERSPLARRGQQPLEPVWMGTAIIVGEHHEWRASGPTSTVSQMRDIPGDIRVQVRESKAFGCLRRRGRTGIPDNHDLERLQVKRLRRKRFERKAQAGATATRDNDRRKRPGTAFAHPARLAKTSIRSRKSGAHRRFATPTRSASETKPAASLGWYPATRDR